MIKHNIDEIHNEIIKEIKHIFDKHEKISLYNTKKILESFKNNQVSDYYFHSSTGYGYNDVGRDKLDEIYAEVFKAEKALVRTQFVSGTHTISTALFGLLKPGDEMIAVTGKPYDTLQTVIGYNRKQEASLVSYGIKYSEVPFNEDKDIDIKRIASSINPSTKLVHIQRSKGYSNRKSLSVNEIGQICSAVKDINKNCICFVDNCYGEFVEKKEPTEVGADIIVGSLIKNPGGGLAVSGGYIAGKAELIDLISYRYTAPGLGKVMGSTYGDAQRLLYQGFYMAPHTTFQALKTSIYAARLFEKIGFKVFPSYDMERSDIIQSIILNTEKALIDFCQAIQENSPVDGHVLPLPGEVPGYKDDVIMAAGTFIQGASIELSADGPIKEPYTAYLQGSLVFEHGVIALLAAAKKMII